MTRSLLLTTLICLSAHAAPVPKAKPKEPEKPSLLGTWQCRWQSETDFDGEMNFDRARSYYHHYNGIGRGKFVGTWEDRGDDTVVVRERLVRNDGTLGIEETWWFFKSRAWDDKKKEWDRRVDGGTYGTPFWGMRLKK